MPSNKLETWTASIAIALGTVVTSYLLGEILMITTRMSLKYDIHVKALDHSLSVMGKMEISGELRRKILDYVTQTHPTLSSQEEFENLCHYISPVLQRQVFEYIYRPIFTSNPLFDGDYKLAKFIISRVSYNFYQPEQEIIVEGTRANDFYFLVKGNCSIFVRGKDGKKYRVCSLAEGNHFGEIGLIYRTYRTATVMSMAYSTAAHLGKNEFRALTSAFPYLVDKLKQGVLQYKDPWKRFVLEIFNQLEAFEHLPLEVFEEIIYKMKVIKVLKGEYLFKTGEPIKGMIAVTNGLLEMIMLLNDSKCALIRSLSYHSIMTRRIKKVENFYLASL